jgi:ubiquinone/menaquinone biosynthesis C-methylase UbiE
MNSPLIDSVKSELTLRITESGFWSSVSESEEIASYDKMASLYDWVIGNSIYNRIIWGNWASSYRNAVREVLRISTPGAVLDCGCGSLVFTAAVYANVPLDRIILLDRSIGMLARARARVPAAHYIQGDALALPFRDGYFETTMSWGMLHIFGSSSPFLSELERVTVPGGLVAISSLSKSGHRLGDHMLDMLHARGEIAAPERDSEIRAAFSARFDLVAEYGAGKNMLTLVGRTRKR